MPTLLIIWKTGNQEGLARKAGAARTPASYSIPEDDDEDENERKPVFSDQVTPSFIRGGAAWEACLRNASFQGALAQPMCAGDFRH